MPTFFFDVAKSLNYILGVIPFHWFKFRVFLKLELILSRVILLSFPDSLSAGLIS